MSGRESRYRERNSTADRALDVLLLFSTDRSALSAAEIADSLGVARSTGYRYLQSLVTSGFVEEDGGSYRLGPRIFELARVARHGLGLVEMARPAMTALAAQTHQTVLLTRRSGNVVVCVDVVESSRPIRISYERGHISPFNAGAAAEVLLAWEDPATVQELLAGAALQRFTARTLTDPRELLLRLRRIRAKGVAVSRGELDPDVLGIAAPIFDVEGNVRAAVSIAGLASRLGASKGAELESAVRHAAEAISARLALVEG